MYRASLQHTLTFILAQWLLCVWIQFLSLSMLRLFCLIIERVSQIMDSDLKTGGWVKGLKVVLEM